jgi:hypothetical protein
MKWKTMTLFFNGIIKRLYFEQHGSWCMIEEWLLCNDMGNVDHLPTNLPTTHPPTYLFTYPPTHSPTYLFTYLLPTYLHNYTPTQPPTIITIHNFLILENPIKKGPHLDKCQKNHLVNLDLSSVTGWFFLLIACWIIWLVILIGGQWTIFTLFLGIITKNNILCR